MQKWYRPGLKSSVFWTFLLFCIIHLPCGRYGKKEKHCKCCTILNLFDPGQLNRNWWNFTESWLSFMSIIVPTEGGEDNSEGSGFMVAFSWQTHQGNDWGFEELVKYWWSPTPDVLGCWEDLVSSPPLPPTRLGLSALAGSIGIQRGWAWERRWAFNLTLATNWFDLPGPQFLLMRMFGKMLTALKNSVAQNR